jgi:NTP pyrophosphatase (non-canonical NTP hydrolase)
MSDILAILTNGDRDEIKEAMKKLLIARIKSDLDDYYLISASETGELMSAILDEVKESVKKEIITEYGETIKMAIISQIREII